MRESVNGMNVFEYRNSFSMFKYDDCVLVSTR